jgi:hypothetical protein
VVVGGQEGGPAVVVAWGVLTMVNSHPTSHPASRACAVALSVCPHAPPTRPHTTQVVATAKSGATLLRGKLNLIDLAGSERISKSGAQGDRLKEAQNINKSLSALGDVIQALQQKEKHIPYRNSKLTRLLEDSLGASASKCVMMCNVSPSSDNAGETKCSLEFALRARKVELGAARRNVDSDVRASPRFGSSLGGAGTRPSSGTSTPSMCVAPVAIKWVGVLHTHAHARTRIH